MTRDELVALIDAKVSQEHDYNTSADALWETAEATFNYVASELGVTGFQAGFAAMMFLRKVNGWDSPFAVIQAEDMLYPQYDILARVRRYLDEWRPWAADEARKRLAEGDRTHVHPNVWRRWEDLAATGLTVVSDDGDCDGDG